ncbi:MAG: tRNA (adenine(22)-N(1))-methyltransferase TrmK [Bacteroidales bacterium]|nr:tRNA (adenine(22)-N(1))-methyltransferase TrmK [Bacteroidales bacterium]
MPTATFSFRQFAIRQDKTAMKAGTDGVLLGAWCDVDGATKILDIGTGTGLIALMCAQRASDATITAIEIDQDAYHQAVENVNESQFKDRITVVNEDFRNYNNNQTFSHIVSNPPFFTETTGSPDKKRMLARQAESLPFDALIKGAATILKPGGKFSAIIPWGEKLDFVRLCALNGLHLCRKTAVISREGYNPIRVLLTFSNKILPLQQNQLTIRDRDGNYTMPYKCLTRDFYLKF